MSTTLAQYFSDRPRLEVCTKHLKHNRKLRRSVAMAIEKLSPSTSPRDLTDKVLKELSTTESLKFLFGEDRIKTQNLESFIYEKLEMPIKISVEAFTGVVSKSLFEAQWAWQKSYLKNQHKTVGINQDVFLAPQSDCYRVYVSNGDTECSIVENVSPMHFLDREVKDRHKYFKTRTATFIKLSPSEVLFLFHSHNDGLQKRYIIPFSRVKHLTFTSLNDGFQQDGLQVIPKDLSGKEFDVSSYGELIGEKRKGLPSDIWCFDQTHRGRTGSQGEKGARGEVGKSNDPIGQTVAEVVIDLAKQGKRLVTTKEDYERALVERDGWVLPMKKSFIDLWKTK